MFRLIIVCIYTSRYRYNMLCDITKLLYYQNWFIFLYILERVTISFFYMVYGIKFDPRVRRKPSCFSATLCSVSQRNRRRGGGVNNAVTLCDDIQIVSIARYSAVTCFRTATFYSQKTESISGNVCAAFRQ